MTNYDIDSQINKEFQIFIEAAYKGTIKIPENIIELFKKAVLHLSPQFHQVNFSKIKQIIDKKSNELTNGEMKEVVKIIVNTPLNILFGNDVKEAIEDQIKLEKFIVSYNSSVNSFQEKLKMKKANLQSLTRGINGNGMKIVQA